MHTYSIDVAKAQAAEALGKLLERDVQSDEIRYPPPDISGDLAFPCFALAKTLKKNPAIISAEIAEKLTFGNQSIIERAEPMGGYLNFHLKRAPFCARVVEDYKMMKDDYGRSEKGTGKRIIIDFSSPNIAKPFSVGHLRSTNIGNALSLILRFAGYEVIGDNHIGDWGTQFGKLIAAYNRWGDRTQIESDPIRELLKLYTRFHEEAGTAEDEEAQEKDASNPLEEEARQIFKRLEEREQGIVSLWEWIREVSLKDFQRVYDELSISFDHVLGESFYNDKMDSVIKLAESKGLLEKDGEGTMLVRLDQYGINTPLLIRKKDGASLYATRDLACALYRHKRWNPEMILYVVGGEQQFYFKQLFKVLELLGVTTRCEHVYFGLIVLPEGKLSTRKGRVIFLEDVIREAIARAQMVIEGRDFTQSRKDEIARIVGIGAVKYHDLSQNRKKNITFNWEKMLSLDGNSSPYLQYSYARARSILRKAPQFVGSFSEDLVDHEEEVKLMKKLSRFPEAILEAADQLYPHLIATYLFELAQQFSSFYNNVPVLGAGESSLVENRLMLVDFFSLVMKRGLSLLGISVLEEM